MAELHELLNIKQNQFSSLIRDLNFSKTISVLLYSWLNNQNLLVKELRITFHSTREKHLLLFVCQNYILVFCVRDNIIKQDFSVRRQLAYNINTFVGGKNLTRKSFSWTRKNHFVPLHIQIDLMEQFGSRYQYLWLI